MTSSELRESVEQRMVDPRVLGRLVCNLRSHAAEQRHLDGRTLRVAWQELGDGWRCVVSSSEAAAQRVAQVDIHDNATVRVEAYEPCVVAVCPDEGVLTLTRFKAQT